MGTSEWNRLESLARGKDPEKGSCWLDPSRADSGIGVRIPARAPVSWTAMRE